MDFQTFKLTLKDRKIELIFKKITYFGTESIIICDNKCSKAWGLKKRPKIQLSIQTDDFMWLADNELEKAPATFEIWEDGHIETKPTSDDEKLNRWCVRTCERSAIFNVEELDVIATKYIKIRNFSKRVKRIHEEKLQE